ncbi:MAG: hypothetical protein ACFCU5_19180 [Pleurocapsa sp.]
MPSCFNSAIKSVWLVVDSSRFSATIVVILSRYACAGITINVPK